MYLKALECNWNVKVSKNTKICVYKRIHFISQVSPIYISNLSLSCGCVFFFSLCFYSYDYMAFTCDWWETRGNSVVHTYIYINFYLNAYIHIHIYLHWEKKMRTVLTTSYLRSRKTHWVCIPDRLMPSLVSFPHIHI